jgi:hypothetical protein
MKTTITTIGCLVLSILAGYGQFSSSVNFSNVPQDYNDGIDRRVYGLDGQLLTKMNWAAALYFGSTAQNITSLATRNATDLSLSSAIVIFRPPTTVNPGTWSSGIRALNGIVLGQTVFMQVRVWDRSQFESYNDALAGGGVVGQSAAFNYQVPSAPTPQPSEMNLWGLRAFTLQQVPEPSTIAICAVGLCSLLLIRRRK